MHYRTSLLVPILALGLGLGTTLIACGDKDGTRVPPTTFSRDQALLACVAADACGVMTFAYAGSYCLESGWDQSFVTATSPMLAHTYECVLEGVPDCAAVEACFGGGNPLQACTDITDGYCEGTVRVECDSVHQTFLRQDCHLANQTCTMTNASLTYRVPKCGMGGCVEGTDVAECQGYWLLGCAGGNYEVTDCSAHGMTCGDGLTGGKACVGTGAVCPDDFPPSCDGPLLTDCVNRRLRKLDCSTLPGGQVCSTASYSCVPAGTDCNPGAPEFCQGTTIRLCVDGAWKTLDCAELGFTGCSVSGAGGAHCVP
jgi:hypothetical protein